MTLLETLEYFLTETAADMEGLSWEIREQTNYEDSDTEYLAEVYDFNKALYDNLKQIKSIIEETKSVFDKIKDAYPQSTMTLANSGCAECVYYNNDYYYRIYFGSQCFPLWLKVNGNDMNTIMDAETERLLEGLYYNHIVVKKEKEPEDNEWKNVALEFGKKLPVILPYSYAELSPNSWYRWVVFTYDKYMEERDKECGYTPNQKEQKWDAVRESVKWCEENQDKYPLDWLKPQTPEQTAQSLKEAFVEAQKTEKWKEIQKLIDEEDNDKNFKNSLDLIKEWGEKNKPPTLKELLWEWWEDIFTVDSDLDADASIDVLVDRIDKEFIPPSSEKNGYEWEKCLKIMRDKLR